MGDSNSRITTKLALAAGLAATSALADTEQTNGQTRCVTDGETLSVTLGADEGGYAGQRMMIDLTPDNDGRYVRLGNELLIMTPEDAPWGNLEGANFGWQGMIGDQASFSASLLDQRGAHGIAHEFFISSHSSGIMGIGLKSADGSEITISTERTFEISGEETSAYGAKALSCQILF